MPKLAFNLPSTPTCKVVYVRDGVNYNAIIPTPRDNEHLQTTMLSRHVGMSQIKFIQPVSPPKPFRRNHPAQHNMARYAAMS